MKKPIPLASVIVLRFSGALRGGRGRALDGACEPLQQRWPGRPGQLRGRHQRRRPLRPRELAGEEPGSRRHERPIRRLRPRSQHRPDDPGQRLEWRRAGQAGLRSLGRLDRRRDQRRGPLRRLQVRLAEPRSRRHEPRCGRLRSRSQDPPDEAAQRQQLRPPGQRRKRAAGDQRRRPLRRLPVAGVESRPRRHEPDLGRLRPRPRDGKDDPRQPQQSRRPGQVQRELLREHPAGAQRERSLRRVPVLGHEPRSRRHEQARGRVRSRPPDRQDRAHEREQRRQARRRGSHRQRQQRAGDQRRRPLRCLPLGGLESRPRRYEPHLRHLRPRPQDPPNHSGQRQQRRPASERGEPRRPQHQRRRPLRGVHLAGVEPGRGRRQRHHRRLRPQSADRSDDPGQPRSERQPGCRCELGERRRVHGGRPAPRVLLVRVGPRSGRHE